MPPDLAVLAVDPGSVTGWACSLGTSGAVDLRKPKIKDLAEPAWHGLLGMRFDSWLDAALSTTRAGVLVVERQLTHGLSSRVLLGLRMIAMVRGRGRGILVEECWTSQWRPWAERELAWWEKSDELDARAMLNYWMMHRYPRMEPSNG